MICSRRYGPTRSGADVSSLSRSSASGAGTEKPCPQRRRLDDVRRFRVRGQQRVDFGTQYRVLSTGFAQEFRPLICRPIQRSAE